MTTFKQLSIGDKFDFINPERIGNTFFEQCRKTGTRSYECVEPEAHKRYGPMRVGSIKVEIFNIRN